MFNFRVHLYLYHVRLLAQRLLAKIEEYILQQCEKLNNLRKLNQHSSPICERKIPALGLVVTSIQNNERLIYLYCIQEMNCM